MHATRNSEEVRVLVVDPRPLPFRCHQYASWNTARGITLTVAFGTTDGIREFYSDEYRRMHRWTGTALSFEHVFLDAANPKRYGLMLDAARIRKTFEQVAPELTILHGYLPIMQLRSLWLSSRSSGLTVIRSDGNLHDRRNRARREHQMGDASQTAAQKRLLPESR